MHACTVTCVFTSSSPDACRGADSSRRRSRRRPPDLAPGRWRGQGAQALGLAGQVTEADLATVLAGRDPATGARLVGAQGSAGRRPKLGVGAETRRSPAGSALYDLSDAAAVLGLPAKQIDTLLDVGTTVALSRLLPAPDRVPAQPRAPISCRSSIRPGTGG
jgi:TrwC relaxase